MKNEQITQISTIIRCIESLRRISNYDKPDAPTRKNFDKAIAALNNLVATLAEQAQNPGIIITEDSGK